MADFNCAHCHALFQRDWSNVRPPKYCSRACSSRDQVIVPEAERIARNKAFVSEVNGRTFCVQCKAQPIEWHNPDHVELGRERFRIGQLVQTAKSIDEVQAEMDRCTPLCRRCHMIVDGRFDAFMRQALRSKVVPAKPCVECERPSKPLRRGLCSRCYDRRRHPEKYRRLKARRLMAAEARVAS